MVKKKDYFFVQLKNVNPIIKSTYGDIRNALNLCDIRYVLAVDRLKINVVVGLNEVQEKINKYFYNKFII